MQKKFKIKKGDTVKVIAGAALGQQGVILDVDYVKERVFIEGLSVVNKNMLNHKQIKLIQMEELLIKIEVFIFQMLC
jgi:large subunit ribosomal protein L24